MRCKTSTCCPRYNFQSPTCSCHSHDYSELKSEIRSKYELKKATHVIIFEAPPTAVTPTIFPSGKVKSGLNMSWKRPTCCSCFHVTVSTREKSNQVRLYEIRKPQLQLLLPRYDFYERESEIRSRYELKKPTCSCFSHVTIFTSGKAKSGLNMIWKRPNCWHSHDFCERKSEIRSKYELKKAAHVTIFETPPAAVTPTIFVGGKTKSGLDMSWKRHTRCPRYNFQGSIARTIQFSRAQKQNQAAGPTLQFSRAEKRKRVRYIRFL